MYRGIVPVRHKTPLGLLEGLLCRSVYGQLYVSFEGIPYGKPPIGELRFKAPQPADQWEGVLDCTEPPNEPVQRDIRTDEIFGSEDCLYLNIYVKKLRSKPKLPVMVYIYGGRFVAGFANRIKYNPDYFMMQNVVIVTFNYRVGALGFLSMYKKSLDVPGNAGLKDIVLALKWIKKHIAYFNGDPDNITLFGESAGAASVHFMLTTPQANKLFHKAILQSGSMFNPWAYRPANDKTYEFAHARGYTGDCDEQEILEYLCSLDACELVEKSDSSGNDPDMGMMQEFGPTMEPYETEHCILCEPPEKAVKTAWGNNIPVIIGGTSFEGLIMYAFFRKHPDKYELLRSDPQLLLPAELQNNTGAERKVERIKLLVDTYFSKDVEQMDTKLKYMDVFSMRFFWHGIYQAIQLRMHHAKAPTYVYRFDFDSPIFGFRRMQFTNREVCTGVAHADDLQYIFHHTNAWKLKKYSQEYKMIKRMVSMWTTFACTSDPNCKAIEPAYWCPTLPQEPFMCFNISQELNMTELPEKYKIQMWKSLFRKNAPSCI